MATETKILYSKPEAAQLLSISPRFLNFLIAGQKLSVVRAGKRVLVPRSELERFAGVGEPVTA